MVRQSIKLAWPENNRNSKRTYVSLALNCPERRVYEKCLKYGLVFEKTLNASYIAL